MLYEPKGVVKATEILLKPNKEKAEVLSKEGDTTTRGEYYWTMSRSIE